MITTWEEVSSSRLLKSRNTVSLDLLWVEGSNDAVTPTEATDGLLITLTSCVLWTALSKLCGDRWSIGLLGSGAASFCCFLLSLISSSIKLLPLPSESLLSLSLRVGGNIGETVTSLVRWRKSPRFKCSIRSNLSSTLSGLLTSWESVEGDMPLDLEASENRSVSAGTVLFARVDGNVAGEESINSMLS